MAIPRKASGQMPHGGSDNATLRPPTRASAAELENLGTRIDISERR
jgi:hypothetical protein